MSIEVAPVPPGQMNGTTSFFVAAEGEVDGRYIVAKPKVVIAFAPREQHVLWPMLTDVALTVLPSKTMLVWLRIPADVLDLVETEFGREYVLPEGVRERLHCRLVECGDVVVQPTALGISDVLDRSP